MGHMGGNTNPLNYVYHAVSAKVMNACSAPQKGHHSFSNMKLFFSNVSCHSCGLTQKCKIVQSTPRAWSNQEVQSLTSRIKLNLVQD